MIAAALGQAHGAWARSAVNAQPRLPHDGSASISA